MGTTAVLQFLLHTNQLKRTARTGWGQRGVPQVESVAAHSYGVITIALTVARLIEEPVNIGRLLVMAALHDLPEGLTSDIPTPAWRFLPANIKESVERGAMNQITADVPFGADIMAIWEELQQAETAESRLVHDADKLDMYLQAWQYEQQTGNRHLAEFWHTPYTFFFPQSQTIYHEIRQQRGAF